MAEDAVTIDLAIRRVVREILGDTDSSNPTYSDTRIKEALRTNRFSVRVRDPLFGTAGYVTRLRYHTPVPVPWSDIKASILYPEPDGLSFQSPPWFRYWDQTQPPEVYLVGTLQTITTDYTVDYINGRVTFVETVEDYKPVQASFVYYRVYHAARNLLATNLASGDAVNIKLGDNEYEYAKPQEAIAAIDAVIAEMEPKQAVIKRRIY